MSPRAKARTNARIHIASVFIALLTLAAAATSVFAVEPEVPGSTPTLRLISQGGYANTISRIFGPDIAVKVRFAPVNRVDGLLGVGRSTAVLTSGRP